MPPLLAAKLPAAEPSPAAAVAAAWDAEGGVKVPGAAAVMVAPGPTSSATAAAASNAVAGAIGCCCPSKGTTRAAAAAGSMSIAAASRGGMVASAASDKQQQANQVINTLMMKSYAYKEAHMHSSLVCAMHDELHIIPHNLRALQHCTLSRLPIHTRPSSNYYMQASSGHCTYA
jgi:hypothetical protein